MKKLAEKTFMGGTFHYTHLRAGKVLGKWSSDNLVPEAGRLQIMDELFNGAAAIDGYILIYSNTATIADDLLYTDIGALKDLVEITDYASATRPAWTSDGAAVPPGDVSNSAAKASFTFNQDVASLGGAAYVSHANKGDEGGTVGGYLRAASNLSSARTGIKSGDTIEIQYDFACTST